MVQDTVAWSTPSPTDVAATGGLILTATSLVSTAIANGNTVRASAYGDLIAAAADFRKTLASFDPQADSAVLTQVSALLALL